MIAVGIIPARGGSKGIADKNVAMVAGRPLIAWTCAAAHASRLLTRVVVSTDDDRIAEAARRSGVDAPFRRPPELSADETPMLPVLRHGIAEVERAHGGIDVVVLLQPTSPLRRGEHIDAALELLRDSGADSVVTVVPVPHRFGPASVMRIDGGRLVPYEPGATATRRQDKPPLYARNGPAVLAIRRDVLLSCDSLYGGDCRALVMSPEDSIDIDTLWELEIAGFELERRARAGRLAER